MNKQTLDRLLEQYPTGGPVEEISKQIIEARKAESGVGSCRQLPDLKKGVLLGPNGQPVTSSAPASAASQDPAAEPEEEKNSNLMMLAEGMVNKAMLQDTAAECRKVVSEFEAFDAKGAEVKLIAPDEAKLQEMQDWAHRCRKRHPLWSEARVVQATAGFFNVYILPNSALDESE